MNKPKSSLVPKIAVILLLAIVAGSLFFVLRPKSSVALIPSKWDRNLTISGNAGTQLRCWLNRQGVSEFLDLQAPTTINIPSDVGSVEIRHTGITGGLDLRIQNRKGESGIASLTGKDQFATLFISEHSVVWSKDRQTVAQLKLTR
jgi:hypothetical protein